jgi:hypothetical protein
LRDRFSLQEIVLVNLELRLLCWLGVVLSAFAQASPGTVYFVVGSDTAIWNYPAGSPTTVDAYTRYPYYKQDFLASPAGVSYQVMDPAFRERFKDSFGQPLKLTWWMMGGNIYRDATNVNIPLANAMTLYLMRKYHGDRIQQFDDEVSLHYHTFIWTNYGASAPAYWNQSFSFAECRADFDVTLAQYLLEGGVFPVSFRSGWHYMDNDWQAYLNQLIPFCLHNDYGVKKLWAPSTAPIAGVEDWSQATSLFIPFHPATSNYQVAGNSRGWNTRSVKMQNLTQATMNQIFEMAQNGSNLVPCLWSHLPENYLSMITNTGRLIQAASSNYPAVSYRYCTAVEAMQRWLGATNQPPPDLEVAASAAGEMLTLAVTVDKPIFQTQPFVAVRDLFQNYQVVSCRAAGSNSWLIPLPVPLSQISKVGVAVTDLAGNQATRTLRCLPEDLFLDNLDTNYSEVSGHWAQSSAFDWGLDARAALLASNDTARVRWSLPLAWTGHYNIFVQVPAVSHPAGNVSFSLLAQTNLLAQFSLPSVVSTRWVYVGTALLDAAGSNVLEMAVSGADQPNTTAVADVVKLSPVVNVSPLLQFPRRQGAVFSTWVATQYGLDYTLECQESLGSAWTPVQTVSGNGNSMMLSDTSATDGIRFYRMRAQWHY